MIHMPLKWHHINKCNKKYRKIDILTRLSSSAPQTKNYMRKITSIYIILGTWLKEKYFKISQIISRKILGKFPNHIMNVQWMKMMKFLLRKEIVKFYC
jgi:hypothetical protein